MTFRPDFISFDCYGTLINFEMGPTAEKLFADRVDPQRMGPFLKSFKAYRLDEVLVAWKPFLDVVVNLLMFLLLTSASVIGVVQVHAQLPAYGPPRPAPAPLRLSVTITSEGLVVSAQPEVLSRQQKTIAARRVLAMRQTLCR